MLRHYLILATSGLLICVDMTIYRIFYICFVDQLQTYFLVTDDIVDQSDLRRGQPCWYKKVRATPFSKDNNINFVMFCYNLQQVNQCCCWLPIISFSYGQTVIDSYAKDGVPGAV